jgi:hypothetical protein
MVNQTNQSKMYSAVSEQNIAPWAHRFFVGVWINLL